MSHVWAALCASWVFESVFIGSLKKDDQSEIPAGDVSAAVFIFAFS